jgi:outer membrane lipoprotein
MKGLIGTLLILLGLVFFGSGCAPVISKGLRAQVDKEIRFEEVIQDPDAYQGKIVLWAGVIIGAKNRKEGTLIEVLEKPTDMVGRPKDVDRSRGRFLALYDGYLEVAIYAQGREVTVAGEITGKRVLPLDEIEYTYPVISVKEIHLWSPKSEDRFYPYPYWHYHPWWWYYPYWGPW